MIDTRLINLSNDLMHLCIEHKVKIASAESCTGGLLSSSITHISGASNYFDRGFISYSNSSKISILGVSPRSIEKFGAVSVEVAQEMAIGAIKNSKADYSIAITGIAGPGGSDGGLRAAPHEFTHAVGGESHSAVGLGGPRRGALGLP